MCQTKHNRIGVENRIFKKRVKLTNLIMVDTKRIVQKNLQRILEDSVVDNGVETSEETEDKMTESPKTYDLDQINAYLAKLNISEIKPDPVEKPVSVIKKNGLEVTPQKPEVYNATKIFERRKFILENGCSQLNKIQQLVDRNDFEGLLKLHELIYNSVEKLKSDKGNCSSPGFVPIKMTEAKELV